MAKIFPISGSRYIRHIRWRARPIAPRLIDWSDEFTPFALDRTDTDSCVLSNGIRKCGTHLLDALIENLGYWKHTEVFIREAKYVRDFKGERKDTNCLAQSSVKKLRNGQLAIGHVQWSPALDKILGQATRSRRTKHVLIYRDPRDAFVAAWRALFYPNPLSPYSKSTDDQIHWRESFADDDERLSYVFTLPNLWTFPGYEPWLRSPNCLAVKFEDLYPEIVDLQHNVLGAVLKRTFDFLEIDASTVDAVDLYNRVHDKSPTASTEEHKIGQYKRVFKDQHYSLIDTPEFRHTLDAFGYEW